MGNSRRRTGLILAANRMRRGSGFHAPTLSFSNGLSSVLTLVAGFLMLMTTLNLQAQLEQGSLTGTIKDPSGAVVPNVPVTLTNGATGVAQNAVSTSTGTYSFVAVNAGTYTLKATANGFEAYIANNVQIHVAQTANIDIKLSIGNSQQVVVTSAAPLLQTQDASVGQTIQGEEINNLPLVNRNWASLAQLNAGVTTANANFGSGPGNAYFNINGNMPWQNDFRLDGIDDNIEVYGGLGANITPPPDAIEEFKMQAGNYSAEFGHSTSGIINAVLKSGTNRIKGDLWEYLRNGNVDANDYFNKLNGTPRPSYHQNNFGGTVGGPVWIPKIYDGRNKTFFFFDYQANLQAIPAQYTETVPTSLMQSSGFTNLQDLITYNGGTKTDALGRIFPYGAILDPATTRSVAAGAVDPVSGIANTTGGAVYVRDPFYAGGSVAGIQDFTANTNLLNQLPANRIDPNAVKLLGVYPQANQAGKLANNYFQAPGQTINTYQYDLRIDEDLNPSNVLFGAFDWSHTDQLLPSALPGIADGGVYGTGNMRVPVYMIAAGYTHIFNPSLTNEFHAGYSNYNFKNAPTYTNETGIPAQYGIGGIPEIEGYGGLPSVQMGLFTNLGSSELTYSSIRVLELMDNVTKIHGSSTYKMGFQVNRIGSSIIQSPTPKGQFSYGGQYSDVPNASTGLLGIADLLIVPGPATVPNGISLLGGIQNWQGSNVAMTSDLRYYFGAYFQDDWKATSNLTINLGLRWDYTSPYAEINGRQANFVQSGAGDGAGPAVYHMSRKGCTVPRSAAFDALLATSGITLDCSDSNSDGLTQKTNFAPRIGFAYRVRPNLVVRGGYGITYGALDNIGFYGNLGNNYPFSFGQSQFGANSQTPILNGAGEPLTLENTYTSVNLEDPTAVSGAGVMLNGREYNYQTPYTQSFNLSTQYQFTNHDAVQATYVGVLGRHLDVLTSHNVPSIILPPGTANQDYAPFPAFNYSNSQWEGTNGMSSFNAGELTYEHQTTYGLNLLANYTYSKCMSNQNGNGSIISNNSSGGYRAYWLAGFGAAGDYAVCDSDSTHVVHVSGTYQLPVGKGAQFAGNSGPLMNAVLGGWALNYIYTFQSGSPFFVGCPIATSSNFGCYANEVPGANPYAGGRKVQEWLNPAAFAQPPMATEVGQSDYSPLGGSPYPVRGPVLDNVDASLFKSFLLGPVGRLEFRAEAFNLLNHPQFGQPGNTSGFANTDANNSNGFSAITYLRNPARIMQFALKLYF
jgi:Carboxypeptidase regulatory-like domain/TonB-dependent Receptor Plug Domain